MPVTNETISELKFILSFVEFQSEIYVPRDKTCNNELKDKEQKTTESNLLANTQQLRKYFKSSAQ